MEKERKYSKIIFIMLSIIIVIFSATDNIISSNEGSISLISFESFYVYIVAIIVSFYNSLSNKNPNISIIIALLTYLWTFYLVHQIIEYVSDIKIIIEPNLYIYLSSSIFLIIALFLDNKKKSTDNQNLKQDNVKSNINSNDELNENNFIFTSFVYGFKEIPYNTTVLLLNNITTNSIDLVYTLNNNNQTKKLALNTIKNISYTSKARISNSPKTIEENEAKSTLLSAVMFGGNPLIQIIGNNGFNSLFNSISNNYDKININVEYEIVIQFLTNNEEQKLVFISENNPETFIKQILNI